MKVKFAGNKPVYATEGAACFDLQSNEKFVQIRPGESAAVGTGTYVEVPDGHVMLVFSRSGHGFKHGVRLSNCVGVIDSDYRGEIKVKLHNDGLVPFEVSHGERIAQGMILPVPRVHTFEQVSLEDLSKTERGEGGFGSTGQMSLSL